MNQHPDAAPPCGRPTGFVNAGALEFLCQRGTGHPGLCEVMLKNGARLEWGDKSAFPDDDEVEGYR